MELKSVQIARSFGIQRSVFAMGQAADAKNGFACKKNRNIFYELKKLLIDSMAVIAERNSSHHQHCQCAFCWMHSFNDGWSLAKKCKSSSSRTKKSRQKRVKFPSEVRIRRKKMEKKEFAGHKQMCARSLRSHAKNENWCIVHLYVIMFGYF